MTWPSTPPGCSPADPCAGAPAADAVAFASDADAPSAWNDTDVPATMSRCVVDSTECVANVNASDTPIAADPPVTDPAALVFADAVNSAFASSLPASVSSAPEPIVAELETFEIAIATDGATATLAEAAPVRDSVVSSCLPFAWSTRSCVLSRRAPSSIVAVVESLTMLSATAAPTPRLEPPPPEPTGSAFTTLLETEVADSVTSPVVASTVGGPRIGSLRSDAEVVTLMIASASEPATPTVPPPAPDAASAPNSCFELPPTDAPLMPAVSTTPFEVVCAPPSIDAWLTTFASVIATPAPIAAAPPLAAEPSACEVASVSADDASVSVPPATTLSPAGTFAREIELAIVIATAAATLTPPWLVEALGVAAPPEP